MGKQWKQCQTLFLRAPKSLQDGDCSHEIKRRLLLGRKVKTNLDSILKSRDITLPTNVRLVKAMVFPAVMHGCWELDYKESWALKSWCFWNVVLEKTPASPLDCKEIQPVHSEGDQPWVFFGGNDAKAETPVVWPPREELTHWKRLWCWEGWGQEEKRTMEDEIAGWHHWVDGREFESTLGDGDGQGSLVCCGPWGRKESDATEWLDWTDTLYTRVWCLQHSMIFKNFLQIVVNISSLFLLLLSLILLYGYPALCLSIKQLMGFLVVLINWLVYIQLL